MVQAAMHQIKEKRTEAIATKCQIDKDPSQTVDFFKKEDVVLEPDKQADRIRDFNSSLTSLVLRLPGFDQVNLHGLNFIKINSDEI